MNMNYLISAEQYCEARGDELWFKNLYTQFREFNNIRNSVWKTLNYLYDSNVADLLERAEVTK